MPTPKKLYPSVTETSWKRIVQTPHAPCALVENFSSGPSATYAHHSRVVDRFSPFKPVVRKNTVAVTWEEFGHAVAELTLFFQSKGLGRGDRIAVLGWPSFDWMVINRAAKGLGLNVVPPHPNSTKDQVTHVLNDSQPRMLLVESQKMMDELVDLSTFKRVRLDADGIEIIRDIKVPELVSDWKAGLIKDELQVALFPEAFQHVPDFTGKPNAPRPDSFRREAGMEFDRLKTMFTTAGAQLPFEPLDTCTLIYTSGSTGVAKGAKHTHNSIAAICDSLTQTMPMFGPQHVLLLFLPISHIYGMVNGMELGEVMGVVQAFGQASNLEKLLSLYRPDLSLGVPLIWNRIKAKIDGEAAQTKFWRMLAKGAFFRKADRKEFRAEFGKSLPGKFWAALKEHHVCILGSAGRKAIGKALQSTMLWWALQQTKPGLGQSLANRLVYPKIRKKIGMENIVMIVSGSAAIPIETTKRFEQIGIKLREGYGSTETCGGWCVNTLDDYEYASLGRPIPGAEVRFPRAPGMPENTAWVEVRGDFNFSGYWRNPVKTKEVLSDDNWYQMGDTVRVDEHGRLWFQGRGDMKKTAAGEFYSEERIQTALEANPLISAVPTGEECPCIGALIFLDPPTCKSLAGPAPEGANKLEFYAQHPVIIEAVKAAVAAGNAALLAGPHALKWEQVRKWIIVPVELTVENGLRTNTLKPKNKLVLKQFESYIKQMYDNTRS